MSETMTLEDLGPLKGEPPARVYVKKVDAQGRAYATGKRKDAVARVWVKPGPGKITVNGREHVVYFARPVLQMILKQPLGSRQARGAVRRHLHRERRRTVGAGRRRQARHLDRAHPLRA